VFEFVEFRFDEGEPTIWIVEAVDENEWMDAADEEVDDEFDIFFVPFCLCGDDSMFIG